jgi:hypothetical protein
MFQGKFALNMELEKHRDTIEYQLHLSYKRYCSNLHLHHFKIYFEDVNNQDLAAVANAKVESKANVPMVFLRNNGLVYVIHSKPTCGR